MQKKIKSLLPSLKERKRYLVYEIISDQKLAVRPLQETTRQIKELLGIFDSAKAGIIPIDYKNNKCMIRVNNKFVDKVKSTFLFINELGTQEIIIKSLGVSGMINKARTKYM